MCVPPKAIVRIFVRTAAIAALLLVSAGDNNALAESGCLGSASSPYQAEVDAFLERPAALLDRYPAGGPAMSAHVQRLAASDPSTVHALVTLAAEAKPLHVVAIGIGLGRAAAHCTAKRPDLALKIRQRVAAEGSSSLRALFMSEATATELALGAPTEFGPPTTPESADRAVNAQTGAPSALDATLKTRAPGILLPTNFGVPLGPSPDTRALIVNQTSDRASTPAGTTGSSPPSAPLDSGPEAALTSLGGFDFFASRRSPGAAEPSAGGDEGLLTSSAAESSSIDVNRARWSSGGGYKGDSYFGSGGATQSAQDSVSPVR